MDWDDRTSLPMPLRTPFLLNGQLVTPGRNRIGQGRRAVTVQPKVMDLLCFLASEPGRVFTRGALRAVVWDDVVVGEAAIDRVICLLRRALSDDARAPRLIEVIRKRGCRLKVGVIPVEAPAPAPRPPVLRETARALRA